MNFFLFYRNNLSITGPSNGGSYSNKFYFIMSDLFRTKFSEAQYDNVYDIIEGK